MINVHNEWSNTVKLQLFYVFLHYVVNNFTFVENTYWKLGNRGKKYQIKANNGFVSSFCFGYLRHFLDSPTPPPPPIPVDWPPLLWWQWGCFRLRPMHCPRGLSEPKNLHQGKISGHAWKTKNLLRAFNNLLGHIPSKLYSPTL